MKRDFGEAFMCGLARGGAAMLRRTIFGPANYTRQALEDARVGRGAPPGMDGAPPGMAGTSPGMGGASPGMVGASPGMAGAPPGMGKALEFVYLDAPTAIGDASRP